MQSRISILTGLFLSFVSLSSLLANTEPTEPDCLCPPVTGISATSTATTMTISWTTSADFNKYIVNVLKGGVVYFYTTTEGGSAVINGTSPSTTYVVKVWGVCGDGQAVFVSPFIVNTVQANITCGFGDAGDTDQQATLLADLHAEDQIESLNDLDFYYFDLSEPTGFTVTLGSLSNDYDLLVFGGDSEFPPKGFSEVSTNAGVASESISFNTSGLKVNYPFRVTLAVIHFGTAYNSYDCYNLSAVLDGFSAGGGGNLVSGSGLEVTPDPSGSSLSLTFDSSFQADDQVDVQVFSVEGRVVLTESAQVFKGEKQIKLDLPNMSDGIYFVNATGAFGKKSQKFVVAK